MFAFFVSCMFFLSFDSFDRCFLFDSRAILFKSSIQNSCRRAAMLLIIFGFVFVVSKCCSQIGMALGLCCAVLCWRRQIIRNNNQMALSYLRVKIIVLWTWGSIGLFFFLFLFCALPLRLSISFVWIRLAINHVYCTTARLQTVLLFFLKSFQNGNQQRNQTSVLWLEFGSIIITQCVVWFFFLFLLCFSFHSLGICPLCTVY